MQTTTANGTSQPNMGIYDMVRSVPEDALSPITGGPMKGKSNINPQWRIEMLTSLFGPVGIGWKVEQVSRWSESTPNGEVAVFCEVNLYVKKDGQWSEPIFGQGGNMLMRRSTEYVNGQAVPTIHIDDEAYKKAYTDALSVACKALGFASDIYYAQDETKYGTCTRQMQAVPQQEPVQTAPAKQQWPWNDSFKELTPSSSNWRASVTQVSKMAGMDSAEILQRITSKFNITRENFEALLSVANNKAA